MARSKNRKKKKPVPSVKLKPYKYIRKTGRKLPIYECRIDEGWESAGMAQVLVSRQRSNGELYVGFYLVDLWCLGLKDSYFREDVSTFQYEEWVDMLEQNRGIRLLKCDPALVFNIIYGAIEYAEDIGFEPPKEFKTTEYLLNDVESIEYMDIEFGQGGRPHFAPGPNDNVERILAILDKNVGLGKYGFTRMVGGEEEIEYYDFEDTLPEEEVEKKTNSLEDPDAISVYLMQVGIAQRILTDYSGDLNDLLEFGYEEEYVDDLAETILSELEGASVEEGENWKSTSESFEELAAMVEYILEKIIAEKGVQFLLEEDYEPAPRKGSDEEPEK